MTRIRPYLAMCFTALVGMVCLNNSASAALLSVDFNNGASPTESGFVGQNTFSAVHSTVAGNITVASTGQQGLFDRGASGGTNNNLYRDFLFDNNSNGFTITLSGAGVSASTQYTLTFYAFDAFDGSRSTTISGTGGTTGTALGPIESGDTGDPDSLSEYAQTGTFTSDGSGNLTFAISGGRTVINALEIDPVPEPSSALLIGLSSLLILRRRRA